MSTFETSDGNVDTADGPIKKPTVGGPCATCMYWSEYLPADTGICRRYAPRATNGLGLFAMWPVTKATDGCGDYVVDPSAPTLAYMMISPPKG